MVSFSRRIVRILEETGLVDMATLAEAAQVANAGDKSVTEHLVESGAFSENELLGVLANRLGVPPIDLARTSVPSDMKEVVSVELAKEARCVPILKAGGILTVAVANPFDVVKHDDLRLATGCDLRLALALEPQIDRTIEQLYSGGERNLNEFLEEVDPEMEVGKKPEEDDEVVDVGNADSGDEAPVIKLVNLLIYNAIKAKASDIHIEPFENRSSRCATGSMAVLRRCRWRRRCGSTELR